ncbi:MAG: ATP-binding protein [Kofleriaceae bacterium]
MIAALARTTTPSIQYLDGLLAEDRRGAQQVVRAALDGGASLDAVYVEILQPAMYELGERWERGEVSVAQEHFCTAATQAMMATLHAEVFADQPAGRRLLALSVGGNAHSIGIRMVADVFELRGWSVMFAGADTSTDAVLATLAGDAFDVLAISAALSEHLPEVETLVRAARDRSDRVRVLVGGRAFRDDRELWRRIGADGYAATPAQAVTLAEALTAQVTPTRPLALVAPIVAVAPPGLALREAATLEAMAEINTELHDIARLLANKNAELERVNAQLNRVMAVIAHDLRNPLSVITHYSQFLREDLAAALGPDQIEFLDLIDSSSEFMRHMLEDLLDVARLRAGKLTLDVQPTDVVELLRGVSALNQHLAERKSIALQVAASCTELITAIDRGKIQQVLNNLVGNAIKYSLPHTAIQLELAADDAVFTVTVCDRGIGIAAADLATVFQPFGTTSMRGTAGEKSTGLGLAISRAIVEAHGGTIAVESVVGEGSSFTASLPRR